MRQKLARRSLSAVPDSKSGQKKHWGILLGGFNRRQHLVGVLFLADDAFLDQLPAVLLQAINIRIAVQISLLHQRLHQGITKPHDVHAASGGKICDRIDNLRGTGRIDAANVCRILLTDQWLTAYRADLGCRENHLRFPDAAVQLRNDLTALKQAIFSSFADLHVLNIILVVERCARHTCPAESCRLPGLPVMEFARKCELSGSSDVNKNPVHHNNTLLRRILVCDVSA